MTTIDQKIQAANLMLEVARNRQKRATESLIQAWKTREKLIEAKFNEMESV